MRHAGDRRGRDGGCRGGGATAAFFATLFGFDVLIVILFSSLGLGAQERLTVGHRDLIVVGMDFAEGQETVTVAAILDEGGLKRRFDARHTRQIDVSLELLLVLDSKSNSSIRLPRTTTRVSSGWEASMSILLGIIRFLPAAAGRVRRRQPAAERNDGNLRGPDDFASAGHRRSAMAVPPAAIVARLFADLSDDCA